MRGSCLRLLQYRRAIERSLIGWRATTFQMRSPRSAELYGIGEWTKSSDRTGASGLAPSNRAKARTNCEFELISGYSRQRPTRCYIALIGRGDAQSAQEGTGDDISLPGRSLRKVYEMRSPCRLAALATIRIEFCPRRGPRTARVG
jgi:hypothetical protein